MLRALSTAATGMEAQELQMDLIANNLANVNTAGFKKVRGEFQDLLYETIKSPGGVSTTGNQVPTGLQVGQGVHPVATLRQFTVGELKQTGNAFDLAIEGSGFFQVQLPSGQLGYTRDGSFKTDAEGRLVTASGYLLEPTVTLPADTKSVTIGPDGTVSLVRADSTAAVQAGQITTVMFTNPARLEAQGHNLFVETTASGTPQVVAPGTSGSGRLSQGYVEMSNVKVVEEMIDLISAQRAYETNSKVIQAADEMLRTTSNLR
jgi:flagellar basal-body rod protein FlgG